MAEARRKNSGEERREEKGTKENRVQKETTGAQQAGQVRLSI